MIPLPKLTDLPSDNLYKFQGIVFIGLALAIYVSMFFMSKTNPSLQKIFSESKGIKTEITITQEKCNKLDSLIKKVASDNNLERYSDGFIISKDSLNFGLNLKYYAYIDSLEKKRLDLLDKKDRLLIQDAQKQYYVDSYASDTGLFCAVVVIMVLFCLFFFYVGLRGFLKWEKYSQRYQDAILMKQAGLSDEKIKEHLDKLSKKD